MLSKLRNVLFFLQILRIVENIPKTVPVSRSAVFFGGGEGGLMWDTIPPGKNNITL